MLDGFEDILNNTESVNVVNSKGCPTQVITILENIRNNIKLIDEKIAFCLFEGTPKLARDLMERKANEILMLPIQISNPLRGMREGPREKIIQIIAGFAEKAEDCLLCGTNEEYVGLLSSRDGKKSDLDKLIACLSD